MTTQADINQIKTAAQLTNIAQNGGMPLAGWREYADSKINGFLNSGSGYQAKVFVNDSTKEIYIANAGTNEFKDVKSWPTVITGGNSPQFSDALKVGQRIDQLVKGQDLTDESLRNYTVNTSGYSWGEGIGQLQAYTFGWKGYGFDGVGARAIVTSAGYQSLTGDLGITSVGKAADFISCNTAGVGPLGGGVVGSLGEDIAGTRSCTIELPSSTGSGVLNALVAFSANTPAGFVANYALGKLVLGVAQHDIKQISEAVSSGTFSVKDAGQTSTPVYQPYSFTDDEGNTLRTKQDGKGNLILGADGKPQYEVIFYEPSQGSSTTVELTGSGWLTSSVERLDRDKNGQTDQTTSTQYSYSASSAGNIYASSFSTTVTDASGAVISRSTTQVLADGTSVTQDYNRAGELLRTHTRRVLDDEGSATETVTDPTGTVQNTYDSDGNLYSTNKVSSVTSGAYTAGGATSILALVKAMQVGKPMPIVISGVNTVAALTKAQGNGYGEINPGLSATQNTLGALASLYYGGQVYGSQLDSKLCQAANSPWFKQTA